MKKYNLTPLQEEMLTWMVKVDTGKENAFIYAETDDYPILYYDDQSIRVNELDIRQLVRQELIQFNKPYVKLLQWGFDAVKSNFVEDEQSASNSVANFIKFDPLFGLPAALSQFKADVFVMMPFKPELKHVYDDCMKPAAQSLNLTINRGDDFFTKHTIMTDIWSAIYHCRLVIADCTGKNANVFYELGLAHTVGKPVVLIAQSGDDIPFDVQAHRYIIYTDTSDGLAQLALELKAKIPKALET